MKHTEDKIRTADVKAAIEKGRRAGWIQRRGAKSRGFWYTDRNGIRVNDPELIERINKLVIPPAWKFIRVSPTPGSRIQAVGMDTSGRIQYIYSAKFAEKQQRLKFARIERFGETLPKLRITTNRDIALDGFPREKVLAIMVRLINSLYFRVGTDKSAHRYKTYGITTLQNRHLEIRKKGTLIFDYVGKSHIKHRKVMVDDELAALMKELKALGGSRKLFHYLDGDGKARPVKPADVNSYLKTATGDEFSSKDFRTWGGSLLAAVELAELGKAEQEKEIKRNIVTAVRSVAGQLGNTPAVCRSSYIHPRVLRSYETGVTIDDFRPRRSRRIRRIEAEIEPEEKALLKLFRNGVR
ncbi:MAG: DNA topoisomerase IB [Acidobacteriota bacterium]